MSNYVSGQGAEAYASNRHGPDGAILLDPYFQNHIRQHVDGQSVIDIGTGAAPWAIYAAQAGAAAVRGFDSSAYMLEQAQLTLAEQPAEIAGRVDVALGAVKSLPVEDETFQVALSLNVGCALPSFGGDDRTNGGTLNDHLAEMRRVLAPEGFGIVTAPISLDTPFTTYGDEEAKLAEFEEALAKAADSDAVQQAVGANKDILRATIVQRYGTFQVAETQDLSMGRRVLRKIPGLVVPNFAHTGREYEEAFANAGLKIVEADKPKIKDIETAESLNLSTRYTRQSAFATYLVQKPRK